MHTLLSLITVGLDLGPMHQYTEPDQMVICVQKWTYIIILIDPVLLNSEPKLDPSTIYGRENIYIYSTFEVFNNFP